MTQDQKPVAWAAQVRRTISDTWVTARASAHNIGVEESENFRIIPAYAHPPAQPEPAHEVEATREALNRAGLIQVGWMAGEDVVRLNDMGGVREAFGVVTNDTPADRIGDFAVWVHRAALQTGDGHE